MAQRGRPLDVATIRRIQRAVGVLSIRQTARETGVSPMTVQKYRPREKRGGSLAH